MSRKRKHARKRSSKARSRSAPKRRRNALGVVGGTLLLTSLLAAIGFALWPSKGPSEASVVDHFCTTMEHSGLHCDTIGNFRAHRHTAQAFTESQKKHIRNAIAVVCGLQGTESRACTALLELPMSPIVPNSTISRSSSDGRSLTYPLAASYEPYERVFHVDADLFEHPEKHLRPNHHVFVKLVQAMAHEGAGHDEHRSYYPQSFWELYARQPQFQGTVDLVMHEAEMVSHNIEVGVLKRFRAWLSENKMDPGGWVAQLNFLIASSERRAQDMRNVLERLAPERLERLEVRK